MILLIEGLLLAHQKLLQEWNVTVSELGEDVLACYKKLAVGFKLTYIPHVEK